MTTKRTDFPLWLHAASGQWAKKVRGKAYYFGTDREAALERWLDEKDELRNGRMPLARQPGGLTVKDATNYYLTQQRHRADNGEIRERTWQEYRKTGERVVRALGSTTPVEDLTPQAFADFRKKLAKGRGALALGREITQTRAIFRWAFDDGLISTPVRFGRAFVKPSKKTRKKEKHARPKRFFEAAEIRRMLEVASVPMQAMILLGVNCGMGQTDIAHLRRSHLVGGWLDMPRPKTHEDRRCPLWDETLEALDAAAAKRPKHKRKDDADRVFITKQGNAWVRENPRRDGVGQEFGKLLDELKIRRPGVRFYALRHVFQTIGEELGDLPAVARCMGHSDESMAGKYREWPRAQELQRLPKVTDHVRGWLFGEEVRDEDAG